MISSNALNWLNDSLSVSSSILQRYHSQDLLEKPHLPYHHHHYHHSHQQHSSSHHQDHLEDISDPSSLSALSSNMSPYSSSSAINYRLNKAAAATSLQTITAAPPLPENSAFDRLSYMARDNATNSHYFLLSGGSKGGEDFQNFIVDTSTTTFPSDDYWITTPEYNSSSSIDPSTYYAAELLSESWWNVWDERFLRHSLGWTITLIVAYVLILLIGIIGNCMVILVVVRRPQMRSVTNMFIMNLAVADLFVIVFCVPATLLANVFAPWILGSVMCKSVAYVQGVSVCASAYSLVAISLDRCKAIYRPMERHRGLSKTQALCTICFIWVIALFLTLPWAVIFEVINSEKDHLPYCVETWKNETHGKVYFIVAHLICCYSLPLILISLSNVVIWCHVTHRKVPQDSASAGPIKRMHRRTRHGVRKMLGIVTLAFGFSWLPLYVLFCRVKFAQHIGEFESNVLRVLMPLAQWLGSWNSCINPVLYAFLNSKFREMFKSLLPAWVPFVHRKEMRILVHRGAGGTVSNDTFLGGNGTQSYTTVYTARSSGRSSNNSRRLHRQSQRNRRSTTMLVSTFQDTSGLATTTTTITSAVPSSVAANPSTMGIGGGCGNCVTSITADVVFSRSITHL